MRHVLVLAGLAACAGGTELTTDEPVSEDCPRRLDGPLGEGEDSQFFTYVGEDKVDLDDDRLACLEEVTGAVQVTTGLALAKLGRLREVGLHLSIRGPDVTSLAPLDGLRRVGGDITIQAPINVAGGLGGLEESFGNLVLTGLSEAPATQAFAHATNVELRQHRGEHIDWPSDVDWRSLLIGDSQVTDVDGLSGTIPLIGVSNTDLQTLDLRQVEVSNGVYLDGSGLESVMLSEASTPSVIRILDATDLISFDSGGVTELDELLLQNAPKLEELRMPQLGQARQITLDNVGLSDLSGLEALESVRGMQVINNPALTSLAGLRSLQDGGLGVGNNPALVDLGDLPIQSGSIAFSNNPALTSISLPRLREAEGLAILDNAQLATLGPFPELERVQRVTVSGLPAFRAWLGSPKLTTVDGDLELSQVPEFADASGLAALQKVGRTIDIDGFALTDLAALEALSRAGSIRLSDGSALRALHLGGLNNLDALTLTRCPMLTELSTLDATRVTFLTVKDSGLVAIGEVSTEIAHIDLEGNPDLVDLEGLVGIPGLKSVRLAGNTSLSPEHIASVQARIDSSVEWRVQNRGG